MWMWAIFGTKTAHLSWTKFFGANHCYYFHLPVGPFHCAKFLKKITTDPELWRCTIFEPKVVHLPHQKFFSKIITIIPIYLLAPFIAQNFLQNSSTRSENMQFMRPRLSISPNRNFFRKPVNEPCFFYSCLSTSQKSQADITLLVKYWWLKNTEISLTESHFWL